jgi:heat shock protein HtpX
MVASLGASILLSLALATVLAWTVVDFLPWWLRYGFWQSAGAVIVVSLSVGYLASLADSAGGATSPVGGQLRAAVGGFSLLALLGGWCWYVLRPTLLGGASPLPGLGGHPLAYLGIVASVGLTQVGLGYVSILSGVETDAASEQSYPDLDATVTRLAQAADVAKPRVAIVESTVPNSMAMGLGSRSTVVVSTGLLDRLDGDELDAVLAHELAHLKNRDATVMTLAQSVSAFARRLVTAGANFNRRSVRGPTASAAAKRASHRSESEWDDARDVGVVPFLEGRADVGLYSVVVSGFLRALTTLLAWPFWVVGLFASVAVSRHRELAADRTAVAVTGDPDALASALRTLAGDEPPGVDLRLAEDASKPACIVPHGFSESKSESGSESDSETVAFRTHPTLDQRLANLKRLGRELESK